MTLKVRIGFVFCLWLLQVYSAKVPSSSTETADEADDLRIFKGQKAKLGQFPWQVKLNVDSGPGEGVGTCGGSLIKTQWVLTAAHCVINLQTNQVVSDNAVRVIAGSVTPDSDKNAQSRTSKKIIVNPDCDLSKSIQNDIALIFLEKPFELDDNIGTIDLGNSELENNLIVYASGWGDRQTYDPPGSPYLNFVDLTTISHNECVEVLKDEEVPERSICTRGSGGKNPCHGDSGGPLFMEEHGSYVVVGVTSFGLCNPGTPSIFTKVAPFTDWIKKTMKI